MIERQIAQNWSALEAGQPVLVTENPSLHYPTTIDELTEDNTVVWIIAGSTRRAFDYREGTVIAPA
ncbi:hypothetical protein [Arthrobacter globiformis]|uniref:hypothetical protein n=1 Tax=Arthrobacter globiformis TaxID=1665 RepID=UPI002793401A|nr:hypothetical protein [Arthrobacter globiformis]MDQ0618191.1 hypothetical protein [Arthrobacter globiformis]